MGTRGQCDAHKSQHVAAFCAGLQAVRLEHISASRYCVIAATELIDR
jgi:hypothetical protein